NDSCPGSVTAISSGTLEASLSPYGDIDVYSFQGRAGDVVDFETFALPGSGVDTVVELLDGNCALLAFNDDVSPNRLDSRVTFSLPVSGTYFIRVRDYRGDGRPDFLYGLRLSGAQ
ncbi:MAG: PPC domain-containing protein, partial [bacterium]